MRPNPRVAFYQASVRSRLMRIRKLSSLQRNRHRQPSSSLSRRRSAATWLDSVVPSERRIFSSPGFMGKDEHKHASGEHGTISPSKGGRSFAITVIVRCSPCKRRTTTSVEDSHHPRALLFSRAFQILSKSDILSCEVTDDSEWSNIKGESKAIRSRGT